MTNEYSKNQSPIGNDVILLFVRSGKAQFGLCGNMQPKGGKGMGRVTCDEWKDVPAGTTVWSGFNYDLTAPTEPAGAYTLYELVDEANIHRGWEWEKE